MKDTESLIRQLVEDVQRRVPAPGRAIAAVSGGIDSTVAGLVSHRALDQRLECLFVDTGLLRASEPDRVATVFHEAGLPFRLVDGRRLFLDRLRGVTDPEKKRKAIGAAFIELFEQEAAGSGAEYLVQGTIAPDWIESGGNLRDTIKSHHNVGGLPENMKLKVVEPLRDLYKDEVRSLAASLHVPSAQRQPFPGPGLAVRILGEVTEERVATLQRATTIVEETIERAVAQGEMKSPWQYFAVLLPLKSTGVMGDVRSYRETVAIRMVESTDAMTASAMHPPYEVLREISEKITRELSDRINRVVYDITDKPPATIEWE